MNEILREAEIRNFKTTWQLTAEFSDRGECCTEQGYLLTSCGMAFADYNLAFPLAHTHGNTNSLRKISRWFEHRHLPFYLVNTQDCSEQAQTMDGKHLVGMLAQLSSQRELPDPLPASLQCATDSQSLEGFQKVIADAFNLPGVLAQRLLTTALASNDSVELWLATVDGRPAATSMITFTRNMAGLYWLSVHPDFQQQGLATTMVNHCLNHILQRDIQYVCLQTQPELTPFYQRLGFEPLCQHLFQRIAA